MPFKTAEHDVNKANKAAKIEAGITAGPSKKKPYTYAEIMGLWKTKSGDTKMNTTCH
jgi:hypothetical protein